jgi:ribA/ribD-fused uncharacterized protein
MITEFRGQFNFLSNFFITPVMFRGVTYRSSEHAYMSAKSNDPQWKAYCINPGVSASDVKQNSQFIRYVDDWPKIKLAVMRECLESKFENPELRKLLIATGNQNIQEGNWWNDRFWGVDLNVTPNIGENHLGRLLMNLRDEIIEHDKMMERANKLKENDSVYVNKKDESEGGIMSGVFA